MKNKILIIAAMAGALVLGSCDDFLYCRTLRGKRRLGICGQRRRNHDGVLDAFHGGDLPLLEYEKPQRLSVYLKDPQ